MKRPRSFDDRLEALVADATLGQLERIRDLAALQIRIMERQNEKQKRFDLKEDKNAQTKGA